MEEKLEVDEKELTKLEGAIVSDTVNSFTQKITNCNKRFLHTINSKKSWAIHEQKVIDEKKAKIIDYIAAAMEKYVEVIILQKINICCVWAVEIWRKAQWRR